MSHLLSIVIPAYNEESVLGTMLQSLKSKLTVPHEIIVCDDKSTDRTVEIARLYADKVIEYSGDARHNISQNRNAGGRTATGEFIVFMDAGVMVEDPDAFFRHALSVFESDPNLVALTGNLKVFPDQETCGDKVVFGILNLNLRFMNNILHIGEAVGKFQMMRKSVFDQVGGFREDLITREDADMFLRLSKIGRTRLDPALTVFHSGRRAHQIGWPRLLSLWIINAVWVILFNKAYSKRWTAVR